MHADPTLGRKAAFLPTTTKALRNLLFLTIPLVN